MVASIRAQIIIVVQALCPILAPPDFYHSPTALVSDMIEIVIVVVTVTVTVVAATIIIIIKIAITAVEIIIITTTNEHFFLVNHRESTGTRYWEKLA